jgi:hypothetical protein
MTPGAVRLRLCTGRTGAVPGLGGSHVVGWLDVADADVVAARLVARAAATG